MKTCTTHLTQLLRDTKEWLAALPSAEESVRRRLFFEALCHATGKVLPALQTALCITGLPSAIASDRSFPWAFGDVPDAELGELFLLLRAALLENHMLPDGLVYTPAWLVDHMVGLLVDRQGMRWCDPACGCGAFLLGVARQDSQAKLTGVDLDNLALSLLTDLLPQATLYHGDTLDAGNATCPGEPRGFDRIIMNPPYRNAIETGSRCWQEQRRYLQQQFCTARGAFDLFVPFLERGLRWLAPGGRLAAVVPDKWLAAPYGRELRKLLSTDNYSLLAMEHAPRCDWFQAADVEPLILLVERREQSAEDRSASIRIRRFQKRGAGGCMDPHGVDYQVSRDRVSASARTGWGWTLRPASQRICAHPELESIGERYQVQASLTTDEFYQLRVREASGTEDQTRLLSSGCIDPFVIHWGKRVTRFRGRKYMHPVVEDESLRPARIEQMQQPRVLLANLSTRLEACVPRDGRWLGIVNVMQIFCADWSDAFALCAWLNASPVNEWCDTHYAPLRMTGQLSITRSLVSSLPAPPRSEIAEQRDHALALEELGRTLHADPASRMHEELKQIAACWLRTEESV